MSEANTSDEICNLKENIMKRMILIFSAVLLSLASAVYADPNFTATSQQGLDETTGYYYTAGYGGVAQPPNGYKWFDVESRYTDYNCWGALRFDLGTIKNALNTHFGTGNWQVQKVVLNLWDSGSSFGVPGTIEVRFTDDDTIAITAANMSPLVMNSPPRDPINGQFTTDTHDSNGTFVELIAYNDLSGYPEVNNVLFDSNGANSQGATYIANHIRDANANQLTLAFLDADSTVKAGWAGYGSGYTSEHPMLTVTAVAINHFGNCVNPPSMDFNGDCKVDFEDFAIFSSQWMNCGFEDPNDCK